MGLGRENFRRALDHFAGSVSIVSLATRGRMAAGSSRKNLARPRKSAPSAAAARNAQYNLRIIQNETRHGASRKLV
jgi:hypothetical protein